MKKRDRRYKKRKLQTFEFKGRQRRGLLWRKEIYELWFRYAKTHQANGGKIPKEFGDLSQFTFEEWWAHPDYGFELFCEPYAVNAQVVVVKEKLNDDEILMKININADEEILIRDIEIALRKYRTLSRRLEYESRARFQPSVPQKGLKMAKLWAALDAYLVSETMVHRRAIHRIYDKTGPEERRYEKKTFTRVKEVGERVDEFGRTQPVYEQTQYQRRVWIENYRYDTWVSNKMRLLSYQRKVVRDAFKSIENGTFPSEPLICWV
jgi:hypothetical protein